jgi:DDE superfamily endonuclease
MIKFTPRGFWWSGEHHHHGGTVQVLSAPDGRPHLGENGGGAACGPGSGRGRGGDAHATDLGYIGLSPAIRHPHKKPKGGELTDRQRAYSKVIRGVHGVAERANPLLKTTFEALRHVSLDPGGIGAIVKAAHVLLQRIYGRTI